MGAFVYDLTAKRTLFAEHADVRRPPASVEKLYTTAAIVRKLGTDERLKTAVLGEGHLGAGGVWHGDLFLRGGGDPTFGDGTFNRTWELGYGPTAEQLAGKLAAAAIRRVTGKVIGDGSLFDSRRGGPATGFGPDIPDYGGELSGLTYDHGSTGPKGHLAPEAFAAKEFVLALRALHIRAKASGRPGVAPTRARELASVSSPPTGVLLKLMDVPSDDLFAELLTKQLGVRFAGAGTLAAGASVISAVVASYGVHPRIVDGSGLSRSDRSSPREIVDLLRALWRTPVGSVLWDALPVVGVSGTVRTIAMRTPAQGHCVAKTGTLDNVTNLAGYCHTRGGHVVAFALLLDGPSNTRGVTFLGRMVAAIARY